MNSKRLFFAIALGVILVGFQVEVWVLAVGVLCLLWKAIIEYKHLAKPSRWLTNSLTIVFLGLILAKYKTLAGQDPSASFLVLLTSLKLLEERTLRDQKFLVLLGFILLSSLFLFTLEIPALIGGAAAFYALWSSQNTSVSYRQHFFRAVPYVVFLFLFFPRVQNPFGLQGANSDVGTSGFSDYLNPGSISQLQTSQELAFRVQFLKPSKARTQDQYWRGQVLRITEGLFWTKKPVHQQNLDTKPLPDPDYEVTLEPRGNRWLFAWDRTARLHSAEFPLVQREHAVFESFAPLRERAKYSGKIEADHSTTGIAEPEEAYNLDLQIPAVSDKVLALANSVAHASHTPNKIADAYLRYFRENNFRYSKSPGKNSGTLESFLFESRKGYCEHYAATLATLLRLSKVPARVVTGYQGGQYNGYGNFWRFTQADAHAWVEFRNNQNRWERIDPTSVVAPERIEYGGVLFEEVPEAWIGQDRGAEFLRSRKSSWFQMVSTARDRIESLNYDVVLFLLDFNLERQKELLAEYRTAIFVIALLLLLPFLGRSYLRRKKWSEGEWLLDLLEKRAQKFGLVREPSETLRNFVVRWAKIAPQHTQELEALLQVYEGVEYANNFAGLNPKDINAMVRRIKPVS